MIPARLVNWLLARAVANPEAVENIKGDLLDECRRRPAAVRGLWYRWQALRIAAGYGASYLAGRRSAFAADRGRFALGRDVRDAIRLWRTRPGFTALAVATLGLGIGATTAILSVVDQVMVRSLPYPHPDELVTVWNTYPQWRGHEVLDPLWDVIPLSYPEYRDWRDGQSTFQRVAIYATTHATLTGIGDPALIGFGAASSTLFPMLGVRPHLGRSFRPEEEGAGGTRVAVVSYRFWQGRLGGVSPLAARSLMVDGNAYVVIGVLPEGFHLRSMRGVTTDTPDVWIPAGLFGDADDRGWHLYEALGRLRTGVSPARAVADIGPLLRGDRDPERMGVRVLPRQREETAAARGPLLVLLLAAALLMVIAAVNVATLFTAEASKRRREFATRQALGASHRQLARQIALESGSIGLLGAAVGVIIALVGVPVLLTLAPPELGLPARIPVDLRVLAGTAVFGMVVGIVFGAVPGLLVSRPASGSVLNVRTVTHHRVTARAQRVLITVEAALSIVLLVGTGLLVRTLGAMEAVDPGFRRQHLLAVSVPLTDRDTQPHRVMQLARDLTERLGALPGVDAVTGANAVPFSGEGGSNSFEIEGRQYTQEEKLPEANRRNVLPGFHETLGIPLLAGRTFNEADREDSRPVVIVSQSLAEEYWPGDSPLGAFIVRDRRRWEIVGVVGDILHSDLRGAAQPTFYFPFYQQPPADRFWMVLRSRLSVDYLAPSIRHAVATAAPNVAVGKVEALGGFVEASTASARYRATLVALFGGCSLLLAAVGVFGLTARMVAARRRELGIRVVLGARGAEITRTVMTADASAIGIGIAVGLVLAMFAVRGLDAFLFGVSPHDPGAFIGAAAALAAVGLMASYLPARAATRTDPVEVLRAE